MSNGANHHGRDQESLKDRRRDALTMDSQKWRVRHSSKDARRGVRRVQ